MVQCWRSLCDIRRECLDRAQWQEPQAGETNVPVAFTGLSAACTCMHCAECCYYHGTQEAKLEAPGIHAVAFSPKGTFLITFQRPSKEAGNADKNLKACS